MALLLGRIDLGLWPCWALPRRIHLEPSSIVFRDERRYLTAKPNRQPLPATTDRAATSARAGSPPGRGGRSSIGRAAPAPPRGWLPGGSGRAAGAGCRRGLDRR